MLRYLSCRDPTTRQILTAWAGAEELPREVFSVANDPVNAVLSPGVGQYEYGPGHTEFTANFLLSYPNPLPPGEYPGFSSGPQYRAAELFTTFAQTGPLLDPLTTEVSS